MVQLVRLQLESLVTKMTAMPLEQLIAMHADDWALIFDGRGRIKGMFVPDGKDEEDAPEDLLTLLKIAGINITQFIDNPPVMH